MVERNTEPKVSAYHGIRPLTRRRFISTLVSATASAYAGSSWLDYLVREPRLLAEAAELSREL